MHAGRAQTRRSSRFKNLIFLLVLAAVAAGIGYGALKWQARAPAGAIELVPTYVVGRGDLTVTVVEGGTLQATSCFDVKSRVEGRPQILSIIPEGTVVTADDVKARLVLVKLDSSSLEEKEAQQQITFQNAQAAYTQSKEAHAIQQQQNASNIAAAELEEKFGHLELERYLGAELAAQAVGGDVDFSNIRSRSNLGGQARQTKRNLKAAETLAREELSRAEKTCESTRKLVAKKYLSREELVADELQVTRRTLELEKAKAELELFLRYSLPKEAEQRYADFQESKRELERVMARSRSQLAQAQASLNSKKATFLLQKERLEKLQRMIESSTLRASQPGLVVYASTIDPRRYRNNPIQEGATVREGETIISVPDLSTLAARVEIHETDIEKVKVGQTATITVEAIPGPSWQGRVVRISPMARSEHRWLNPNVMVYDTEVAFEGAAKGFKPGMSATAEILVARLTDVLSVPIQAITTYTGKHACWVASPKGLQLREVETGYLTDTHVEIKRGLKEGEKVLLARPDVAPADVKMVELPAPSRPSEPEQAAAPPATAPVEQTGRRGHGREGGMPTDPERMLARLKQMEPERRQAALSRLRERLKSLSPEERQKWEKALDSLLQESRTSEDHTR